MIPPLLFPASLILGAYYVLTDGKLLGAAPQQQPQQPQQPRQDIARTNAIVRARRLRTIDGVQTFQALDRTNILGVLGTKGLSAVPTEGKGLLFRLAELPPSGYPSAADAIKTFEGREGIGVYATLAFVGGAGVEPLLLVAPLSMAKQLAGSASAFALLTEAKRETPAVAVAAAKTLEATDPPMPKELFDFLDEALVKGTDTEALSNMAAELERSGYKQAAASLRERANGLLLLERLRNPPPPPVLDVAHEAHSTSNGIATVAHDAPQPTTHTKEA
jgi:hypothetical protein